MTNNNNAEEYVCHRTRGTIQRGDLRNNADRNTADIDTHWQSPKCCGFVTKKENLFVDIHSLFKRRLDVIVKKDKLPEE
jgi:hypothetical protein